MKRRRRAGGRTRLEPRQTNANHASARVDPVLGHIERAQLECIVWLSGVTSDAGSMTISPARCEGSTSARTLARSMSIHRTATEPLAHGRPRGDQANVQQSTMARTPEILEMAGGSTGKHVDSFSGMVQPVARQDITLATAATTYRGTSSLLCGASSGRLIRVSVWLPVCQPGACIRPCKR
jgi:hypothetical protein